jgi:ribosomal protein S18 acetylase RimI-like enzyme
MELRPVEIPPGPDRRRWVPVLELADEPRVLRAYLDEGVLYGFVDEAGAPTGAVLVIDQAPGVAELRNVAVAEHRQGRGLGTRMIGAVLAALAARGTVTVHVGTASSGVRQLAFYQRCGFRLTHVERDYFTAAKGYPPDLQEHGIPSRDMVWMERAVPAGYS